MFYNYRKLFLTKELRNYTTVECIIISQNMLDFATSEMILCKGVKKVINCIDYIYTTGSCEEIVKKGIDILYLPASSFKEFDSYGKLDIGINSVVYNKKSYIPYAPENKSIEPLIRDFVWNTIEYMDREKELIWRTEISGYTKEVKPVSIIISRGEYGIEDVKYIKKIIKEKRPSIICVDGGYDIALKYGLMPDMVIGDMDSINKKTIGLCEHFIIHSYLNGHCPGQKRIPENKKIGFIKCFGTSEDAAILYCIKKGSTKIYTLGFHVSALDNIEKGRKGMSSSLLLRLYYGHIIADIKQQSVHSNKMLYIVSSAAVILLILYFSFFANITTRVFK